MALLPIHDPSAFALATPGAAAAARTSELKAAGARWLLTSRRCIVIATEPTSYHSLERPDLIGWAANGFSTLIEVKISAADYRRDRHKMSEQTQRRMGSLRYYLTPPGLLRAAELPEGWGLLELRGSRIRICKLAVRQHAADSIHAERTLLATMVRRAVAGAKMSGEVTIRPWPGPLLEGSTIPDDAARDASDESEAG